MKIAINGFGRIGRIAYRVMRERHPDLDLVAVNDLTDAATLAHLLKYDSIHGRLGGTIEAGDRKITVDGDAFAVFAERDPAALPWKDLGVDVVIESTGHFRERDQAARHLEAGARKVVISAPGKNVDITVCMGVNDEKLEKGHDVISNASCTTNCLTPVAKVILATAGWVHGLMTTAHAYTADQNLMDGPHKDLRRARSAALSIVPTSTGAARAAGIVLPELAGKVDGTALRVPTSDVSIVDLTVEVAKKTSAEALNAAFEKAADGELEGILAVNHEPLVSIDFVSTTHSAVVDAPYTTVLDDTLVKVMAWYDNEMGYASRLVDLTAHLRKFL